MRPADFLTITLSFLAIILIPLLIAVIRMSVRWARMEDKLANVVQAVEHLVADKDKVHSEMLNQMAEDRKATNQRLRWLEENVWGRRRERGQNAV